MNLVPGARLRQVDRQTGRLVDVVYVVDAWTIYGSPAWAVIRSAGSSKVRKYFADELAAMRFEPCAVAA